MDVKNILASTAGNLGSLANRLVIQANAQRTSSDKKETLEHAEACLKQAEFLIMLACTYGPVIQAGIDTGVAGNKYKITVCRVSDNSGGPVWEMVSNHVYTV